MAPIFWLYLAQKLTTAILKLRFHSSKVEKLTIPDFLEIEIFLYKSSPLNMNLKEFHQYLSLEKSLFSNGGQDLAKSENVGWVTK